LTVEEVYTNAFDGTYVAWTEVGSSPYLHNTNTDYIDKLTSKTKTYSEGCWSFPNSAGSGTINSVKLRFEDYRTNLDGDASMDVYVWDGTSWVYVGYLNSYHTSYAWEELDVSSILNTWDKINGAKVYLQTSTATLTDTLYVRRLTRKVDYTEAAIIETITAKNFPMLYLSKPVKAQELISKVEGATITKVANDFPEELIKSGKAAELKSKFAT